MNVYVFLRVFLLIFSALLRACCWPIMILPRREPQPGCAPGSSTCSSRAPQTTAPSVVSPPLPRQLEGQHLQLCVPGQR